MPFIIFGGLLMNVDEIPDYFVWFSVFSFVQYGEIHKLCGHGPSQLRTLFIQRRTGQAFHAREACRTGESLRLWVYVDGPISCRRGQGFRGLDEGQRAFFGLLLPRRRAHVFCLYNPTPGTPLHGLHLWRRTILSLASACELVTEGSLTAWVRDIAPSVPGTLRNEWMLG